MTDDARVKRDINRLVEPARPPRTLPERAPVAPIPASVGVARPVIRSAATVAAGEEAEDDGIDSPLTEVSSTMHASHSISSDGLFAWMIPQTIDFEDASGRPVQLIFLAPP